MSPGQTSEAALASDEAGPAGAAPAPGEPGESRLRARLRLAEERFDDIARLVSDWIWETDREFRFTLVSPRIGELLGFHPREIVGRDLFAFGRFHAGLTELLDAPAGAAAALPDPARRTPFRDMPYAVAARDGRQRLFLLSGLPVFAEQTGAFLGFRGTARDVTEAVEARREAKQREDALAAARDSAEAANRAKSAFLANVSHELRTPLNAIIGFSEMMRDGVRGPLGNPVYVEYLGCVVDSAQHLLTLINDILDVAKSEAGKLELEESEFSLAAVVATVLRLLGERAQRAGVALAARPLEHLPPLYADERLIRQILINLLANAIKFTEPGGRIETGASIEPSGELRLWVSDTGIGIASDQIGNALAPFGQIDSRLARKYEGTGLGLPLSRAFAERHGGTLELASEPGSGTTVIVRLPAARLRPRQAAPAALPSPAALA
jgi:PAS domain S-box-containing protein